MASTMVGMTIMRRIDANDFTVMAPSASLSWTGCIVNSDYLQNTLFTLATKRYARRRLQEVIKGIRRRLFKKVQVAWMHDR